MLRLFSCRDLVYTLNTFKNVMRFILHYIFIVAIFRHRKKVMLDKYTLIQEV